MWKSFKYINNKYRFLAIITGILTLFQVIMDLLVPSMLSPLMSLINDATVDDKLNVSFIYKDWIISFSNKTEALIVCSVMMVCFSILGIAFGMISTWLASKVAIEVARSLRFNLFKKIQTLSESNISKLSQSSLITRLTNDVTQVQTNTILSLRLIIRAPLLFVGGLIFSLLTSLKLSISLAVMIPSMLIVIGVASVFVFPLFRRNQKIIDSINNESRENILGVKVIKSFNLEETQFNKFKSVNYDWQTTSIKAFRIINIILPVVIFITNFSMLVTVLLGWWTYPNETKWEFIIENTSFSQYLGYITGGLIMTIMVMVMFIRSRISSQRINEVFDTNPNVKLIDNNIYIESGDIDFDNVSFKYSDGDSEKNVLTDITFSIKQGQTLGIIGPTGSGKSTLVNLISRTYEVTSGEIKVDNKNINTINTFDLNKNVSQVLQESILFSGTIRSNLLFGNNNATDKEIDEAIDIACAKDYIYKFPLNLEHPIEQRGKNLSGGQKQRLQIARGIIRKPKILILDDSTSALDTITDKTLRENIKKKLKFTTTIIVAQKINSIKDADKIIVLEKGKMIGYGNHKQLMKNCNLYKEIADSQLSNEENK